MESHSCPGVCVCGYCCIRHAGNLLLLHLVAKYLRCALFTFYLVSQMVFVRVVRVVQQGRVGRGLQWGICHVAMFGSLPANKYGALSVSRADGRGGEEGRYKQCHIWQAQVATLLIQLAGCGTFCQVALAPNSYLPLSVSASPSLCLHHPLSLPAFVLANKNKERNKSK